VHKLPKLPLRNGALCPDSPLWGYAQTRNDLAGCATQTIRSGAHTLAHEKSLHFGKIPNGVRLENSRCYNRFRYPAG